MKNLSTDTLVIGGGPAGTPLAMGLARAGRRVVLVEAGPGLGGTCLFYGCIPSKIFRQSATVRTLIERASRFGITGATAKPAVDWATIQKRRHVILNGRAAAALSTARAIPSLTVLFGRARLSDPHSARVESADDTTTVTFETAVIATGSASNTLRVEGAQSSGVLSSEALIGIGYVPDSMAVIGGGPIGVEMAQIFQMLGSKVTILEALPAILQPVDRPLAVRLEEILVRAGIGVETGVSIERIEATSHSHRVHYRNAAGEASVDAGVVLTVVGRHPNLDGLGLESTRVRSDSHGIKVNESLRTDEPNIYAAGDVVGQPMFAHWATAQAQALAAHLLGRKVEFPRPDQNSAVIFSYPELGMVGLTEEGAAAAGMEIAVAEYNYASDARAQIADETEGMLRIIYRKSDSVVVGVHILAEGAADLMGEAALAVSSSATLAELAAAIHPHPTLSEAFGIAAQSAART